MTSDAKASAAISGERGTSLGNGVLPAQSRVSNVLAIGLMSLLGLGMLTWYYANALMRQGRAKQAAQAITAKQAQGDMPLPSLGRIGAPSGLFEPTEPPPRQQAQTPADALPLMEVPAASSSGMAAGVPSPKTAEQVAQDRQLSGEVFSSGSAPAASAIESRPNTATANAAIPADAANAVIPVAVVSGGGELSVLLHPGVTSAARARMLPAQRLLLAKGAFIDCTLETAIDSTLPGMTTCVTATDVFGVDGKVVLLERGTKLIGETRGQVQQGAARIFVLWTEARTPTGVIVPLDSPGTDDLGRSGLSGEVSRHFWQRFGAAMLVSVVDGAVQSAVQSSRSGGGTVVVNPSASQDVLTEILKSTVNIPPTVVKQNGDRIQVLVARDLDFRSVYELRSVSEQ